MQARTEYISICVYFPFYTSHFIVWLLLFRYVFIRAFFCTYQAHKKNQKNVKRQKKGMAKGNRTKVNPSTQTVWEEWMHINFHHLSSSLHVRAFFSKMCRAWICVHSVGSIHERAAFHVESRNHIHALKQHFSIVSSSFSRIFPTLDFFCHGWREFLRLNALFCFHFGFFLSNFLVYSYVLHSFALRYNKQNKYKREIERKKGIFGWNSFLSILSAVVGLIVSQFDTLIYTYQQPIIS